MIPRIVHFVFGLEEQEEPFHFVHYLAIESCRRHVEPETIYFHHKHLPWGPWWDAVEPHLTMVEVDLVDEVLEADYSRGLVSRPYRYAHHADFIRLDVLIEHGGIYADLDTVFVRPFPEAMFDWPFVIGAETAVPDELTREMRPSLCNALLMAEPKALFATTWRERMADAMNGTWSNHSGFLSCELSQQFPEAVHLEPEATFFAFPPTADGLFALFEERHPIRPETLSVHLWAHLWWEPSRIDFGEFNSHWATPAALRRARTTLGDLARPYLERPTTMESSSATARRSPKRWTYVSLDELSGYGVAATRCRTALESSGLEVDWTPFVPGGDWGFSYQPPSALDPFELSDSADSIAPGEVVVAHLVPEFLPLIRERSPDTFLVGHTVWETDRIPDHWISCLESADMLVVPSRFSAQSITSSPVSVPVEVVPHVTPPPCSRDSHVWSTIPEDVFVFYTIAEWTERKAVYKTIDAYLRAFRSDDPVVLVVKTSYRDLRAPGPSGRSAVEQGTTPWSLAKLLSGRRDPPNVCLVVRQLSDSEICALHRRGDCFVSLSRGEGWGIGAFDAAAHGNPVVTTGFGGQLDYLADSPYLVDFDLVAVENLEGFPSYASYQHWADPDIDHGATLLREVNTRRQEAKSLAHATAEDIRERFSPPVVAETFRSAVEKHYNSTPI